MLFWIYITIIYYHISKEFLNVIIVLRNWVIKLPDRVLEHLYESVYGELYKEYSYEDKLAATKTFNDFLEFAETTPK